MLCWPRVGDFVDGLVVLGGDGSCPGEVGNSHWIVGWNLIGPEGSSCVESCDVEVGDRLKWKHGRL